MHEINKKINVLKREINTNKIKFNEENDKKYIINSLNNIKKLINDNPRPPKNNINKIKTQYHHYIPQFILRKFDVNNNVTKKISILNIIM